MLELIKKMFGISAAPVEAAPYKVEGAGVVEVPAAPPAETATQAMVESLAPSAAVVTAENKTRAAAAVKRAPAKKTTAKKNYRKPAANKPPVK